MRQEYTPEFRYQNDSHFHALVDLMESYIHAAQFTPSELREAAMLAAIRYDMKTTRPFIMDISQWDEINGRR